MENDTIVREAARREMTGVSRAQWWRFELEGNAPKRVQLGPGSIGWRRSDLERWVRERPPAAPKGVPTGLPKDELDYHHTLGSELRPSALPPFARTQQRR